LGRYADELAPYYRFSPAAKLQASLSTKERQYALAEEHGMPRPRTAYVQSNGDLRAFIQQARFPCLLKPRHDREWATLPEGNPRRGTKAVVTPSESDLLAQYGFVEPYRPEAVVQELIVGPDNHKHCYLAVYGSDGSRLGHCVVRELRCNPTQLGSAMMEEPVIDPEIDEVCDSFLRKIGYTGLCEIEVKRDAADGKVKLIEVNPRFSGTGDCSLYAGVEVGWLHYLDLIGKRPAPVEPHGDFHHINLRLEVPGVLNHVANGLLTWSEVWRSYRGHLAFYDFDLRDLRVTRKNLWACTKMALVTLRRNGFRLWAK
jgi:predicted ATP-grasp superfamily ATP-dependent carboligase